jgi:hypothetical protein
MDMRVQSTYKTTEGSDGEILLWICCNHCGKPIEAEYVVCVWSKDKHGEIENVAFVHPDCEYSYEFQTRCRGRWFSQIMLFGAAAIVWAVQPIGEII